MSDFRRVTDEFWASPQITLDDLDEAHARGFRLVINNRPEGEAADQLAGPDVERAVRARGMSYLAIPVTPGGFSGAQVNALADALSHAEGPVLAYCRSGTRSTLLWALAQASLGRAPDSIAASAAGAGYDVAPIQPLMNSLATRRSG